MCEIHNQGGKTASCICEIFSFRQPVTNVIILVQDADSDKLRAPTSQHLGGYSWMKSYNNFFYLGVNHVNSGYGDDMTKCNDILETRKNVPVS